MTTYEKLKEALEDGDIYDAKHYALELEIERVRLRKWIEALDEIARCTKPRREWHGEIGWLRPGQVAYVGANREDVLSNNQTSRERSGLAQRTGRTKS